nr:sugar transferase [Falsirhodobacter deserti]
MHRPRQRSLFSYRSGIKRALDILFVLLLLPIALPLVVLMALLVATDGASPFYRQARVGRDGRIFSMWKMRSMVVGADAALARHLEANPEARAEWDSNQKLKRDPRITRVGRILRKTSLDELPQLWNVMWGDMSLVGPRPMMVDQQPLYPGSAYFRLRPGITGNWQVSKRHETEFSARATYDAAYEENLSLKTDLRILCQTVGVVLRATGC